MEKLNNEDLKRLLSETTVNFDLATEWEAIEAKMDRKKKKKRYFWWWLGIGAVLLLFAGTVFLTKDHPASKVEAIDNTEPIESSEKSLAANSDLGGSEEDHLEQETRDNSTDTEGANEIAATIETAPTEVKTTTSRQLFSSLHSTKPSTTVSEKSTKTRMENDNSLLSSTEKNESSSSTSKNDFLPTVTANKSNREFRSIDRLPVATTNLIFDEPKQFTRASYSEYGTSPNSFPRYSIYAEIALSSAVLSVRGGSDMAYQERLRREYTVLSKTEAAIGTGFALTPRWQVYSGIYYKQHRSVYRGGITAQSTTTVPVDTARVYTNSLGGNIFEAGEVVETTTTLTNVQQYNYHHAIGLQLGTRYQVLGPLYAGAQVTWTPVLWESGLMLYSDESVRTLKATSIPRISAALELGYTSMLAENTGIEIGVRYQPNLSLSTIDGAALHTQSIGGKVRLFYTW